MSKDAINNFAPWKEFLFRLPEIKFLNIVRMYIGVIKTPYNKERLAADLVSFLYKEENKTAIINLLSEKDILFLSAVCYLDDPTNETLLAFFAGEYTAFYLYDYISNLEERLLLFRTFDERTKKEHLAINPLLQEKLEKILNLSLLLPLSKKVFDAQKPEKHPALCASLFGSWYAFIAQYPDACRADGSFKKKTLGVLETVFYNVSADFLTLLNTAFVHLGLFFHDGSNLCINEKKWKAFSTLKQEEQNLYICAASFRRFPYETLLEHASFAKNLINSVPEEGLTKGNILRLGFIIKNRKKEVKRTGFFAKVLQRSQNTMEEEDIFSDSAFIDKMVYFGLLVSIGQDKKGNDILIAAKEHQENQMLYKEGEAPFISINAGFSVTFLSKVRLDVMTALVSFMNITNYDTVCRFEITRASCMRCFNLGSDSETLLDMLKKASGNVLSQNLIFSITEWFETFNSAALYHGYVLQVSQEKIVQIENNSVFAPRIKKVLAPGIYLFDFETRDDMLEAIDKSMLDFIGLPKNVIKEPDALPYREINNNARLTLQYEPKTQLKQDVCERHLAIMKEELEKLSLTKEQKEGLRERIDRKIIISPKQLVGETVRSEKLEASGIDFMGKIQVIEQAIAASNMIEITSASGMFEGRPIKVEKKDGDASVTLSQEDGKSIILLIGQARNVKRFRQPLY